MHHTLKLFMCDMNTDDECHANTDDVMLSMRELCMHTCQSTLINFHELQFT